jgi:hypothetical protein
MRILFATLLFVAAAEAQSRHVSGTVVDSHGAPIPGAVIADSDRKTFPVSDSQGHFEITTTARRLVIGRTGFTRQWAELGTDPDLRVALRRTDELPVLRLCTSASDSFGLGMPSGSFRFPKIPGVEAQPPVISPIIRSREYAIKVAGRRKAITHRMTGGVSEAPVPPNRQIWAAHVYQETVYRFAADELITDTGGQSPDGTWWRRLVFHYEVVSYDHLDAQSAQTLDQLFAAACVTSTRSPLNIPSSEAMSPAFTGVGPGPSAEDSGNNRVALPPGR